MKLVTDENKYIVYLYRKEEIPDFNHKEKLEDYFRNFFLLLNEKYELDICGYYNLYVFLDTFYGMILEIEKEEYDYFESLDNQVDMRITFDKESIFLYKISDLFLLSKTMIKNGNIYYYQKEFYYEIKKELKDREMAKLMESTTLVYGNKIPSILKYGSKLNFSCTSYLSMV